MFFTIAYLINSRIYLLMLLLSIFIVFITLVINNIAFYLILNLINNFIKLIIL